MHSMKVRVWDGEKMIYSSSVLAVISRMENGEIFFYENMKSMWSTSLKDKNGKEIYEGDIVKTQDETGPVCFEEGLFAVNHKSLDWLFGNNNQEVIGNIYENPELLEKK